MVAYFQKSVLVNLNFYYLLTSLLALRTNKVSIFQTYFGGFSPTFSEE